MESFRLASKQKIAVNAEGVMLQQEVLEMVSKKDVQKGQKGFWPDLNIWQVVAGQVAPVAGRDGFGNIFPSLACLVYIEEE